MLHPQSILGLSLLVLSCASPTLGAMAESPSASVDSLSPPPSPNLGTNSDFSFRDTNPPASLLQSVVSSSTTSSLSASTSPAATSTPVSVVKDPTNPTTLSTTQSLAYASTSIAHGPSYLAGLQRAKHHANIAAHFSTQLWLQAHTHTQSVPTSAAKMDDMKSEQSGHVQPSLNPSVTSAEFLAQTALATPSTLSESPSATSPSAGSSAAASLYSVPASPLPTSHDFDDPNPDAHSSSEASQRARKTAVLAAFLILGSLGALGGGVLCFRCGILPCCDNKTRRRRVPNLTDRTVEEGLRSLQKLAPITSKEKSAISLIPGTPPTQSQPTAVPLPPRNAHTHTLSCSTCPPDSLNGVKGGVSGNGMGSTSDWRMFATNEEGDFEDLTHILSSDAFSGKETPDNSTTRSRSPRDSAFSGNSTDNRLSTTSDAVRTSIGTLESTNASMNTSASRASQGAPSMTAESYTTCESRYSTPSIEHDAVDRPPSAFASISEESENDVYQTPSPGSPQSSTSTASGGSVSVLLMTPEQPDYNGLADAAAVPKIAGEDDGEQARAETGDEVEDMEVDMEGSEWDVATAYGAPPTIPLPPIPSSTAAAVEPDSAVRAAGKGKSGKSVKGRPQTGVGLVQQGAAVDVGGRTCVLMHG